MRKRNFIFAIILALLAVLAIGCSSDSNNEEATEESGQSEGGGTLVFAKGGDAVTLDPSEAMDSESENITFSILETLVTFAEGEMTVEPQLATEWEESDDGLTYTFHLREGVKFHDGTDFNADAVVYNFERWMNAQDMDRFYMYGSVFGGFVGDENHLLESVEAVDEHTVTFTLNNPSPTFLKDLALPAFSISSPAAIEEHGDKYNSNPVGTGPFVFDEWRQNERIVVSKNEDYWLDGYPKLDQVIFRVIPDNSARLNALVSGEIDMMDGVEPENIEQIETNEELEVLTRPSLNLGYIGLTTTREPMDNKLVRQALNHAIDKDTIIESFFAGQAIPAKNPIPPSVEGYNDDIEGYAYDPEKAKELLEEAGLGDGFDMELWAMPVARPYMPDSNKVAEYVQSNLADIGVNAEIVSYEWATYQEKAVEGEADAFFLGWTGTNGDAHDFIYTLFHEDSIGSLNSTQFANDELNDVLDEARTTIDQEKRNELYQRAQEIMHEEAPIIPLVHTTPALAAHSSVSGFDPHPTGRVITTKIELSN